MKVINQVNQSEVFNHWEKVEKVITSNRRLIELMEGKIRDVLKDI